MAGNVAHATRNLLASLGAGVVMILCFFAFSNFQHWLGKQEIAHWPVLATVTICDGVLDPNTGSCGGEFVTYEGFQQTSAECDGKDAIVSGVLSKVRSDAVYIDGAQVIYFGTPNGRFRRATFDFMDRPAPGQTNRPPGVQDWGPWRLIGGCVSQYTSWFTTVEHQPWHALWRLPTTSGPFPLPRALVVN